MILYVNGDSHSAGAEAVNSYCFAEDDPLYYALGRIPHPDNEKVSYGCQLANLFGAVLHCDAESAASNDRILRTTYKYLEDNKPDLVVIGWTTWEREEWLHEGVYYQVNASGIDYVPPELQEKYKQWVIDQNNDVCTSKMNSWHHKIHFLHEHLETLKIPHVFFHVMNHFYRPAEDNIWSNSFIHPYNQDGTYYHWSIANGAKSYIPGSYHLDADAHRVWADLLYQHIKNNKLISND